MKPKLFLTIVLLTILVLSASTASAVLSDGLPAAYKFDGTMNNSVPSAANYNITGANGVFADGLMDEAYTSAALFSGDTGLNFNGIGATTTATINFWVTNYTGGDYAFGTDNTGAQATFGFYATVTGGNMVINLYGDGAGGATGACNSFSNTGNFTMITLVLKSGASQIYKDGIPCGAAGVVTFTGFDTDELGLFAYEAGSTLNNMQATFDEVLVYNREISVAEMNEIYDFAWDNNTGFNWTFAPPPPPATTPEIRFVSQVPADITSATPFDSPIVNMTFNYTNATATGPDRVLNYTVVTTMFDCVEQDNGTCDRLNNTWITVEQDGNSSTGIDELLISFTLNENDYLPTRETYEVSFATFDTQNLTLTGTNQYISDEYFNVSNGLDHNLTVIYEVPMISTGLGTIYYYNSSYDFASNPQTSSNVVEVCNLNAVTTYNHTHPNGVQQNLCILEIINQTINGVRATEVGGFIIGRSSGTVTWTTINETIRTGATQTTGNNGNTWSNEFASASHVHLFSGEDYILYAAFGDNSGTIINSSFTQDFYSLAIVPPTIPVITNPSIPAQAFTSAINITYLESFPITTGAVITVYNISLLNEDLTFNRTITANNSLNLSYYWTTHNENLSLGIYYIMVNAYDSNGQTNFDVASFNLTRNSRLNVTAIDSSTNATIFGFNVTLNWTDFGGGFESVNTSSGTAFFDVIRNVTYTMLIDAPGYAYQTVNYTMNDSPANNYTFDIFKSNSVSVNIFDADTIFLINNTNITVTFTSGLNVYDFTTDNGTGFVSNLTEGLYTVLFEPDQNYSDATYFITMTNRSTQVLNAFLAAGGPIGTYTRQGSEEPVISALITVQRLINGTFQTVGQGTTDAIGYILFNLADGVSHRVTISAEQFTTRQFNWTPYTANQPYTFYLSANTTNVFQDFNAYITYTYAPVNTDLLPGIYNFSFTTASKTSGLGSNSLLWTSLNCNGTTINITGSPSGTTILQEVDLSTGGMTTCIFGFQVDDFDGVIFSVDYFAFNYTVSNATVTVVLEDKVSDIDSTAWLGIISMIVIFILASLTFQLSGSQVAGTMAAFGGLIFFAFIGYMPEAMTFAVCFIVGLLFFSERSGS